MIEVLQTSLFYQLAALLTLASLLGFIATSLRQPLIVAFIALGLLVGPDALGMVNHESHPLIETLAQLGITLLLFMVGLKLDLGLIKRLGPAALTAGLAQVALTAALGAIVVLLLGYGLKTASIAGIALSFSSTIIVVKLLSDKRAIDSLYGQMALGILIVQDIVVILAMVALATIASPDGNEGGYTEIAAKLAFLIAITGLFIRLAARRITRGLSKTPELMMIFAVGLAAVMAALCEYMDFSMELGGLLAGVALASTPQHNVIAARLSPLRDFLLLFFFIGLGSHMPLGHIGTQIGPALALSAFVLLAKPALILAVMMISGYRLRTGLMTGLALAQISEFSLILIAMAAEMGLAPPEMTGLFTITGLITIAVSCYGIAYNTQLHEILEKNMLSMRRRRGLKILGDPEEAESPAASGNYDVIIFGLGRYGNAMAHHFMKHGKTVLGVDFDPVAVGHAAAQGIPAIYGDAADAELPAFLPLGKAQVAVFAFHHYFTGPLQTDLRRMLARLLREHGYRGRIAATTHHPEHDQDLAAQGIDIILSPFEDAALHGAGQIIRILESGI